MKNNCKLCQGTKVSWFQEKGMGDDQQRETKKWQNLSRDIMKKAAFMTDMIPDPELQKF